MTILDHVHDEQSTKVPGVDVVLAADDEAIAVLDVRALKLIGALHRRFWNRRREMLQRHARVGITHPATVLRAASSDCVADLAAAPQWDQRLNEFLALSSNVDQLTGQQVVAIRGWADTESGVLVDGRAVPGCVFDVAVAVSMVADQLRAGESPFAFSIPEPVDELEAKLWSDLLALAEDRVGIERGVVRAGVIDGSLHANVA